MLIVISSNALYINGLRAAKYFMPVVNWKRRIKKAQSSGIYVIIPYTISDKNESTYLSIIMNLRHKARMAKIVKRM